MPGGAAIATGIDERPARILVTGAKGQLGRALIEALGSACTTGLGRAELDITDRSAVESAVVELRPSVIINAAAYNNVDAAEREPEKAFAVNRDGVAWLSEAARKIDAALIHVSSDYVFDGEKGVPYVESDTPNPISRYGESKLAGEHAVITSCARHVIVRTSWLFSEHGNNFVTRIVALSRERAHLDVVADQFGSPTGTRFLADAISRLLALPNGPFGIGPGHVLHMCNAGAASRYAVAARIISGCRARGMPLALKELRPVTTRQYPTPARRPRDGRLSIDRLREMLHIEPPSWERALDGVLERIAPRVG